MVHEGVKIEFVKLSGGIAEVNIYKNQNDPKPSGSDGTPDLFWRKADGIEMTNEDWSLPNLDFLGVEMRMAQGTPAYEPRFGAIYLTFNRGPDVCINLPEPPQGQHWKRALDTGDGHA